MESLLWITLLCTVTARPPKTRPNIVLFIADDLGYGDLSTYGHPTQEFGSIDRMANEGLKLTQVYSAAAACTPSRAALLTGRQPFRTGMVGPEIVHMPGQRGGLSHDEITLAEGLKQQGYSTAMVGKWHLGINNSTSTDGYYLPQNQGFDYVGTILPFTLALYCDSDKRFMAQPYRDNCFVYRDRSIIQQPIDLKQLTPALVADAKAFIYEHADEPFFLYFSFPQTHAPMYNMPRFKGSSKRGIYGDQVNEISWAVGEILQTVQDLGIATNTLTLFTSDHGPHLELCKWGGNAGPLYGGKVSFHEGGLRVPAIFHWPSVISPGTVSTEVVSLMDIYPTLLDLSGGDIPRDRIIDGKNIVDILLYNGRMVDRTLFIYDNINENLKAVRHKQYKIYFTSQFSPNSIKEYTKNCNTDGVPYEDIYFHFKFKLKMLDIPLLYNVETDPGELLPLDVTKYRDVLKEVFVLLKEEKKTWGQKRESVLKASSVEMAVKPCCNPPYCYCQPKASLQHHGVCDKINRNVL